MSTDNTLAISKSEKTIATILRWMRLLLVITVWTSAGLFGLYILAFYAAALYQGNLERWNDMLPDIYSRGASAATTGIGVHFAMGGIILVLGSIQLIDGIRIKYPAVHRWIGRIYIVACLLAAIGGTVFIFAKGTIGGTVMDIGFALYGALMFVCAIETYRHAVAGRTETHRAWALRLYALAIGSWLYRMDYGFWFLLADKAGHTSAFNGPFDYIMDFFFYIPNLLVAEIFIRAKNERRNSIVVNLLFIVVLLIMTSFLLLGTYFFTKFYWGPAIVGWLF